MTFVTSPPFPPPQQRQSRDPGEVRLRSLFVTECLVTAAAILLSALLLGVLLAPHCRLPRDLFRQLLASLAAGGATFSLLARPGAIHVETSSTILTDGYCGFYLTILDIESIVVAYTAILLTVERTIAIVEPENYAKRFPTPSRVILLASPWVFGLVYGLIRTFGLTDSIIAHYGSFPDDPYYNKHSTLATGQCMLIFNSQDSDTRLIIGDLLGTGIPIVALISISTVLLVLHCRRYRASGADYARSDLHLRLHCDLDGHAARVASVVLVLVSNGVLLVALLSDFLFASLVARWGSGAHWKICAYEMVTAALALSVLPDVRSELRRMFCCRLHAAADTEALVVVVAADGGTTPAGADDNDT